MSLLKVEWDINLKQRSSEVKAKIYACIFLFIGFSHLCFADSNPALWLAQKGEQKLWLLGSIHVGKEDLYPLPENVIQIWHQADSAIFEANTALPPENLQTIITAPEDPHLQEHLSAEQFGKLIDFFKKNNLSESLLHTMQPWFVALLIQQKIVEENNYQSSYGIDQYFMNNAFSTNKQTIFLETPEEQFHDIAAMQSLQYEFLSETLSQMDHTGIELDSLIQAWRQGDYQTVVRLLNDENTNPKLKSFLNDEILVRRNKHWMTELQTQKKAFVVVGTLHLYGPQGLLKLLQSEHYQITRVN